MAIVYVTPGPWGAGTGTPNSAAQIDNNFYELKQALDDIVDNIPAPAEISNMEIVGSQLLITLSNGATFGPYTLPIATFQLRGEYVPGQHYYELDIISVFGVGLFMVRIEHDTDVGVPFDPEATDGDGHDLYLQLFGDTPQVYDVGLFSPGKPGQGFDSAGYLAAHVFARDAWFDVNMPNSQARLRVAPDAALSFDIEADDVVIGTIAFASGETVGVITVAAAFQMNAGDMLVVRPPTAVNDAARDLVVTLCGIRGINIVLQPS
jgi:hypothetical protein